MPMSLPHTDHISYSTTNRVQPKVIEARFGDGYAQRTPDGLFDKPQLWSVVYDTVPTSVRDDVIAALNIVGVSDYFTWTPPFDTTPRRFWVTTDGWSEAFKEGNHHTISFTLEEIK